MYKSLTRVCFKPFFVACALGLGLSIGHATPPEVLPSMGIGDEGGKEVAAVRNQYNLRITFAEARTGAYLAGLTVVIKRTDQSVELRFDDCGPLFYARVDPGVYRMSATYAGITQTRTLTVRARGRDIVWYWPAG